MLVLPDVVLGLPKGQAVPRRVPSGATQHPNLLSALPPHYHLLKPKLSSNSMLLVQYPPTLNLHPSWASCGIMWVKIYMNYHFSKMLNVAFDEAILMVTEELKKQGFGVLTEIDVKETLKKKLGVDFRSYKILGACNPPFAYQALELEDKIGLMLPCNVIVQEHVEGKVEVSVIDPIASMQAIENPKLASVAEQVQAKLKSVIDSL